MSALLEVVRLGKSFSVAGGGWGGTQRFLAVDDVDFTVERGKIVGLVGESGSGKTTVGRCVVRLTEPTTGHILFDGEDIADMQGKRLRKLRRRLQMVFQDPFTSLNPRIKVGDIVGEPIVIHRLAASRGKMRTRVAALLEEVGLPADAAARFPHEFSGGQRQRISIARALAAEPELIVADEPVSALDVSVQAQVLNLLRDLQARRGLSMIFVSHDLEVVNYLADWIVVMYAGRVVETGDTRRVTTAPRHPYTQALISAVPRRDPAAVRSRILLTGDLPTQSDRDRGCVFRTRCRWAIAPCAEIRPPLAPVPGGGSVACINPEAVLAGSRAV
jgi:oligopeptide/dipeptide ABC transporter ATP-binding protein